MGLSRLRKQFNLGKDLIPLKVKEKATTKTQNTNIAPNRTEPSKEEREMYNIVSKIVGAENMSSFETYHKGTKSKRLPHIATVYYKEWAQGVSQDRTLLDATVRAVKLLRIELINKRDKLNKAIDKLPRFRG